ncbi:hypothetical protein ACTXN9_11570 [Corynebacterium casei]|nr:hypothetical protein [Corynebacterium casei]MDN6245841.1 hypothetical protein [Corynebacterium casei]MDN6672797.1 hypothetical protein [Corynebacterium casei]
MESSAIEYAQPEWQGFTSPASIGDKVWIISSRPKPGHIPEWDSKRPHHFGKRAEAEKEMDWLNEHHPLDNYLIACVTVGWVAPKVLKESGWTPPWFPIGGRDEDQPWFPRNYDEATKAMY